MEGLHLVGMLKLDGTPEDDTDAVFPVPLLATDMVDAWDGLRENKDGDRTEDLVGVQAFEADCEDGGTEDGCTSSKLTHYKSQQYMPL